ncbi:MAG: hypothetical protein ABF608_11300 [Sporolactobacillus sp.]
MPNVQNVTPQAAFLGYALLAANRLEASERQKAAFVGAMSEILTANSENQAATYFRKWQRQQAKQEATLSL